MQQPTLEQEREELEAVNTLLKEYEKKELAIRRLTNSLRIMKHTIEQSIKVRMSQTEPTQVPNVEQHKEEIGELGNRNEKR